MTPDKIGQGAVKREGIAGRGGIARPRRSRKSARIFPLLFSPRVMATASRVRIVHGHGMGVLKRSIAELLADHPHVAKFYPAPQQEGGAGATIVELRE